MITRNDFLTGTSILLSLLTIALTSPLIVSYWKSPQMEIVVCQNPDAVSLLAIGNTGRTVSEDVWLRFIVWAPERGLNTEKLISQMSLVGRSGLAKLDLVEEEYAEGIPTSKTFDLRVDFFPPKDVLTLSVSHHQEPEPIYGDRPYEGITLLFARDRNSTYSSRDVEPTPLGEFFKTTPPELVQDLGGNMGLEARVCFPKDW